MKDVILHRLVREVEGAAVARARVTTGIQVSGASSSATFTGAASTAAVRLRETVATQSRTTIRPGCNFFEKPLVGVASAAWKYRGPAAESMATYLRRQTEASRQNDAAIIIERNLRKFVVRRKKIREAQQFVMQKVDDGWLQCSNMVSKLDDTVVHPQAQLAWAYATGENLLSIPVKRSSVSVSLGVDVVVPPQIALKYNEVSLHVSEGYLLVTGIRVRASSPCLVALRVWRCVFECLFSALR